MLLSIDSEESKRTCTRISKLHSIVPLTRPRHTSRSTRRWCHNSNSSTPLHLISPASLTSTSQANKQPRLAAVNHTSTTSTPPWGQGRTSTQRSPSMWERSRVPPRHRGSLEVRFVRVVSCAWCDEQNSSASGVVCLYARIACHTTSCSSREVDLTAGCCNNWQQCDRVAAGRLRVDCVGRKRKRTQHRHPQHHHHHQHSRAACSLTP